MQVLTSYPANQLAGVALIPGDKSISHRAVMLGSIAIGTTVIENFLLSQDCLATLDAVHSMGVTYNLVGNKLTIFGVGRFGLKDPGSLDLKNSGTSLRLLLGILAGASINVVLSGDDSLNQRPHKRVVEPLQLMNAKITARLGQYAPIKLDGNKEQCLQGITYTLPVASAQVKSCILFAGLYANGITTVIEPVKTRDHSEIMLASLGANLTVIGDEISIKAGDLIGKEILVPGDFSSAAFFIVAACIAGDANIVLPKVGVNPTRTGLLKVLTLMGASISLAKRHVVNGEEVADITVNSSQATLKAVNVDASLVPSMIDEYPILCIAAACANGVSHFAGIRELRVKESDRLNAMLVGLKALGIVCKESADSITIEGGQFTGGDIDSFGDHRIAMAFLIAGSVASRPIRVANCDNIATSFPGFVMVANKLGLKIV